MSNYDSRIVIINNLTFSFLANNLTPPLLTERSVIPLETSLLGEETKMRLLKKRKNKI